MKRIYLIALMGIVLTGLVSCGGDKEDIKTFYTVTFDADGGTPVPEKQRVEEGKTAVAPSPAPTKTGFVFVAWTADGTNAYDFRTPVTRDLTLRAKWQAESQAEYWKVTWELGGGAWPSEGDNHAAQVLKSGTLAEPAPPVKANHTFEGWYKEAILTNKVAFPYDVSGLTADFTLYAKWTEEGGGTQTGKRAIASSQYGYFILNQDGTLLASGHNDDGQLGTGNNNEVPELTQVAAGVSTVYAGKHTTFILKTDKTLLGCGSNLDGELGLNEKKEFHAFTSIPVNDVRMVAAGGTHTLILKNDGSVWATGWNSYGQLGVGDKIAREQFTATNLNSDITAIAAGEEHSLALKKDGSVWGAGYGDIGVLGENVTNVINPSFVRLLSGAKAIAAGNYHTLVLKDDGSVYTTGMNDNGQTGTRSTDFVTVFTQAKESSGTPLGNVEKIFAGYYCSFALKKDGTLWASGKNDYGQFATGDEKDCSRFIKIASDVKSASIGRTHSLILKTDGTVQTLGYLNPFDQLGGNGTIKVKVNDTYKYDYITSLRLYDRNSTELHYYGENIITGAPGYTIKVKPGKYKLELKPKNTTISMTHNFTVPENGTVTVLYEWVSLTVGYRWTITTSE